MADEPTGWELRRSLDELRQDLREGFKSVNDRLDKVPTSDLLGVWQSSYDQQLVDMRKDIAEIQEERKAEARERAKANRAAIGAVVTAIIGPILVGVILRLVLGA